MNFYIMFFEAIVLAFTLSIDALATSFAYGSKNIKIPGKCVFLIDIICTFFIGISLTLGVFLRPFLSLETAKIISFTILFLIGFLKLLDDFTKSIIRKYRKISKNFNFSFLNFNFVLNVYADPEIADFDKSKSLSPFESLSLAIALSLDGIAVGFGVALTNANVFIVLLSSFIIQALFIFFGVYLGKKVRKNINFNISFVSGLIIIILAFLRL